MQHYFTVNFSHENQKALELRTEDAKDCDEWVAAIAHARYVSPTPRSWQKRLSPGTPSRANPGPGVGGHGKEGSGEGALREGLLGGGAPQSPEAPGL